MPQPQPHDTGAGPTNNRPPAGGPAKSAEEREQVRQEREDKREQARADVVDKLDAIVDKAIQAFDDRSSAAEGDGHDLLGVAMSALATKADIHNLYPAR